MTTKRSIVTAVAIASAAVGTAVVLTLPSNASAGVPSSGTFTVQAHQGSQANLDLGRHGMSAGDESLFTGGLSRHGTDVGLMVGECRTVRVGPRRAVELCDYDLRFGGAQLMASGSVAAGHGGPGTFTVPITGGTGRYLGAAGQLAITATNGPTVPITVQLSN